MLGHTALARPVLLCSPVLSRQNKKKDGDYRNEQRNENGYKSGSFHVSLLSVHFRAHPAKAAFTDVTRAHDTI